MIKPVIELVVFDMAGTTVKDNHDVSRALMMAFEQVGIPLTLADTNPVMGYPKPEAVRILLERRDPSAATPAQITKVHQLYLQAMLDFYQRDPDVGEKAGASELFAALHERGIKVALDTGFDRVTANVLLQRLGWLDRGLIDTSVTSDEVTCGRPEPDMIYEAMRRTGVRDIKQVAKVGDTPSDLQQGSQAGCAYVIGITTGSHTASELLHYPHTHLVGSLADIIEILAN
jgi:phosphonatase-like hydrolase